jgi:iduronate 2-sulfatase
MIWHQGESDAGLSQAEYQKRLTAFVARVRADLGTLDLAIGVGEVFDDGKRDSVRAAQKATAAAVEGVYFVPAAGLKTFDNGTHFDAASQIELGRRFADGMAKAIGPK